MLEWKDNKSVVMASTCYGGLLTKMVKRWDKKQYKYIMYRSFIWYQNIMEKWAVLINFTK